MERLGHLSVESIRSYERTNEEECQEASNVLSSSSSVANIAIDNNSVVYKQSRSVSKFFTASNTNKENIFKLKDLHEWTIDFNFSSWVKFMPYLSLSDYHFSQYIP